jgi:hypothetical protein
VRRSRLKTLPAALTALALVIAAAACEPVRNAPPGGGTVVQGTYRIGPFNLSPVGQSGAEHQGFQATMPRPTGPFGLKAMDFDIVYANGEPVPHTAVHLHHIVMMNRARTSPNCSTWPERFAASGSERTPIRIGDPYAYLVGAGDQWSALWHIMNESSTAQQVYIQYKMGYQPAANATNTRGVTPFFLDVTGCGNSEYDVPGDGGPGSVHVNSRTWTAPWTGMVLSFGGHLHGGGIDIRLQNDTTGEGCTMKAHYDHSHSHGAPGYIDTCGAHNRVNAGDRYSLISRYENDEFIDGAMGIVLAYVWRGTQ